MAGQGSRTITLCQIESCSTQAKQQCHLCTWGYCSSHGHWVHAAKLRAQRGAIRPDASVWLCDQCAERLGLVIPPRTHAQLRRLANEPTPTQPTE
jgi:hypothetical protein